MSSAQDQTEADQAARAAAGRGTGRAAPGYQPQAGYQPGSREAAARHDGGPGVAQAGFTVLAATLMMLSGLWSFLEGLVAILRQSFFVALPNYTFQFNVHGWGWIHLALGIVIFAAGACVLLGQAWARAVGIVLAVFSGLANFLFLPYYPVWSVVVIAIDVFVIWALATGMSQRGPRPARH
jgi:hypothetical protein